jgi:hypothetical protein
MRLPEKARREKSAAKKSKPVAISKNKLEKLAKKKSVKKPSLEKPPFLKAMKSGALIEREAQYFLPFGRKALDYLRKLPVVELEKHSEGIHVVGHPSKGRNISIYFDTQHFDLRKALGGHGIDLRVRYGNSGFPPQLAVKCDVAALAPELVKKFAYNSKALTTRFEFEVPVAMHNFDPNRLGRYFPKALCHLIREATQRRRLRPVFATATPRSYYGFDVYVPDSERDQLVKIHLEMALDDTSHYALKPDGQYWITDERHRTKSILTNQNNIEITGVRGKRIGQRPEIEFEIKADRSDKSAQSWHMAAAETIMRQHIESLLAREFNRAKSKLVPKPSKRHVGYELLDSHREAKAKKEANRKAKEIRLQSVAQRASAKSRIKLPRAIAA